MTSAASMRSIDRQREINYNLEMRQTAGFALALNAMALVYSPPLVALFTNPGQDWSGDNTTFPPSLLVSALLFEVIYTLINIPIAVKILVQDKMPSAKWALAALFTTLLVWFPFLTVIAFQIFNCNKFPETGTSFYVPDELEPTHQEIRVLTTIYILAFYAYGGAFIGALTFFQWKIWNFARDDRVLGIQRYGRSYYDSRQLYYGDLSLLGGLTQIALGSFILSRYGNGRFSPPIVVFLFTVSYPEMSVAMGILVTLFAFVTIHRGHFRRHKIREENSTAKHWMSDDVYDVSACALFLLGIGIQVLGQVAPAPPQYAATANESASVLSSILMPVYLDMKARSTPLDLKDKFVECIEIREEVEKPDVAKIPEQSVDMEREGNESRDQPTTSEASKTTSD